MNKTASKWIKFSIATFLVAMFCFTFVRQWTKIPPFHIIYVTPDQDAMNTTKGLGDYLHWGTTFAFFTTLSNVIAISLIFVDWASFGKIRINKKIKVGALLYMIVTAIVFWTSIAPFMPWGYDSFFDYDNVHEHAIVFIATIWFVLDDKRKIETNKKDYFLVLIFPIIYLIFTSVLFFVTPGHIAIYTFLDFYDFFAIGWDRWLSVLITSLFILLLLGIFILAYWILVKIVDKYKGIMFKRGKNEQSYNQKNSI